MALSIKSETADRLARELAAVTGESLTEVVEVSLRERLARQQGRVGVAEKLRRLQRDVADLPMLDGRTADEILGYDRDGLPT
jgi:antitoxin VapB